MFENWWNLVEPSSWVVKLNKARGKNSLEIPTESTFLQILS